VAAHGFAEEALDLVIIKTTGDAITDRPLADVGGKGLFTKEIEDALLARTIDIGVHSMKDMQTVLPHGLAIGAVLPREDPRDAFISLKYGTFDALPKGAVVGTSSLRRQAQAQRMRPDLTVVGLRGNVQTRLAKLEAGVADATFLACAGLNRLGLQDRITSPIPVETMLPAVAQGAIAIEVRDGDDAVIGLLSPLNDPTTAVRVTAERAFLTRLEGSCRTPIAGFAALEGGTLHFRGMTFSPDGRECFAVEMRGSEDAAAALGTAAAEDILARGGRALLAGLAT
jgi:hydroxymethylbilane synthase